MKTMILMVSALLYSVGLYAAEDKPSPPKDEVDHVIDMGILMGRATFCGAPREKLDAASEVALRYIIMITKDDKSEDRKKRLKALYNKTVTVGIDPKFDDKDYPKCDGVLKAFDESFFVKIAPGK